MSEWLQNPRRLFWIALVAIIFNCSALTVTKTVYNGDPTILSVVLDFFPLYGFLFAFWFFKNLAASSVPN
jgi:hypothetical protein